MIKPMLAKDYKEHKHKLKFPVWSQPKLDGLRCVITREGAWSRQWKPFVTLGHLCEALQPLFEKHPHIRAFDGEAYTHGLRDDFNQVVSIIKQSKAKPEDLKRAREIIEFHIYDFIPFEEVIEFEKRSALLKSMIEKSKRSGLQFVRTDEITSQEQMDELMSEYLAEGFEGLWISDFTTALPLIASLRWGMQEVQLQKRAQMNAAEDAPHLFNYVTSQDFRNRVVSIVRAHASLREGINKERKAMEKNWKLRETQVGIVEQNIMAMLGSIEGNSGHRL